MQSFTFILFAVVTVFSVIWYEKITLFVFQQENVSGRLEDISKNEDTSISDNKSCPLAWSKYENGCYWILQDGYNWLWARSQCQKLGAELVSIHSKEQDNFIALLARGDAVGPTP